MDCNIKKLEGITIEIAKIINKIIEEPIKIAMSNSLGFGGHNASIIIKKFDK